MACGWECVRMLLTTGPLVALEQNWEVLRSTEEPWLKNQDKQKEKGAAVLVCSCWHLVAAFALAHLLGWA